MPGLVVRFSSLGVAALGLVLLLASRSVLEVVTTVVWQVDLLRYLGLFMVPLGLISGWDDRRGSKLPAPVRGRVAGAWMILALYVFTAEGFLLIMGFSLLVAVTLEIVLVLALAYSDALRSQLDASARRQY